MVKLAGHTPTSAPSGRGVAEAGEVELIAEPKRARAIACATWLVLVVYAYPGYMSWDVDAQLRQARNKQLGDWHPPAMAAYWHVIELFARGPFPLLVLQTTLFVWGVRRVVGRHLDAVTAAWVTMAIVLFPPIVAPMAVIWKDAQMAAFFAAGLALAIERPWWRRSLGTALLVAAVAVRDNAVLALPPLALWIASTWVASPKLKRIGVAIGLTAAIASSAFIANRMVVRVREYPWYHSVAIHDIAGTICNDPSISDSEIARLLAPTGVAAPSLDRASVCARYSPRVWFGLVFDEGPVWKPDPDKSQRLAREAAWLELVREHPGAYLAHRWRVFREVVGLVDADPWEPVCQTFNANDYFERELHHDASQSWFQRKAGAALAAIATTIVFRPWIYALISTALLFYALLRRYYAAAAIAASGLLFELGYLAAAAAPDFRYSHWMITCTAVAGGLVHAARLRAANMASK